MKKALLFAAIFCMVLGAVSAQDLALGQKIDMSLFTKTNEKPSDPNLAHFRMIAPQNNKDLKFLADKWDEISVLALSDGTITRILYNKKSMSENAVKQSLLLFLFYFQNSEYSEDKPIKIGDDMAVPRFLKPGTSEGVVFMPDKDGFSIIFSTEAGNFERNLAQALEDVKSRLSPAPQSPSPPPRQTEGSMSIADDPPSSGRSTSSWSSDSSVDFGFTIHLNFYLHGWHQNLISGGIPLQLGMELELPVITLDILGEASGGMGYGNMFEYRLGGMAELYFFERIGLGAGLGIYGSAINLGFSSDSSEENPISYAPPVQTNYYRFGLIFRGDESKITLYAELYGDGKWGFGVMSGGIFTN
jgi:hypothetical protein